MNQTFKTVTEFLSSKQSFKYQTFETFYIDSFRANKKFPELTEQDLPQITEGIITYYKNECDSPKRFYEKTYLLAKLEYFLARIENRSQLIWHYKQLPNFPAEYLSLLFIHLHSSLSNLVSDFREKIKEGNFRLEHIKDFTYKEVASLIHVLRASNFFRPNMEDRDISESFHLLTGFSTDSLNNKLSPNAFSAKGSLKDAKESLRKKMLKMLDAL